MSTLPRPAGPPIIEVPARFKPLGCDQIGTLFRSGLSFGPPVGIIEDLDRYNEYYGLDTPVMTTRAVEVRCSVRDCPGRGGWVIEQLFGSPRVSQWSDLIYLTPRGYKLGHNLGGVGVFVPTERMKEQRRRGFHQQRGFNERTGRRPTPDAVDSLAHPLRGSEMPAEGYVILDAGFLIRCSSCPAPRFIRVTADDAATHLANERCSMLQST
jgi:hypothetical protein